MLLHFKNLKRANLIAYGLVVLFSLGFGSVGSSKTLPDTVSSESAREINGNIVPAEPSQALVNVKLAGVDTDGNGVRDEVDRAIARSYGKKASEYKAAIEYAAKTQTVLGHSALSEAQAQAVIFKELEAYECLKSQVGRETARIIAAEVELRTYHPRSRSLEANRVRQTAGVHVLPDTGTGSCNKK